MATQAPTQQDLHLRSGNPAVVRELDERFDDSLRVKLLYLPFFNEIWLSITDERKVINCGETIMTRIPNDKALDAFWHPFCYVSSTA